MFKDKVVLITGASRGIGRATALEFGRQGATVVVNYNHSKKEADKVVKEINAIGGVGFAIQADISKYENLKPMVDKIVKKFGHIDVLVNNAGIVFDREFEDIKYEEVLEVFKTNDIAPLFLSKLVAPIMVKNGYGKIVNVSSTSGMKDFCPGTADYCMSKLALQSLTKDLSMQFANNGINVNAVAPSWVDTDMNGDLPKEYLDEEMEKYHIKRLAKAEEIANAIVFLASDKASYITGHILVVDGGHC